MAKLLVLLNDVINTQDPIGNLQVHKAGDFIIVREDVHVWGSKEVPPVFGEVKIPEIDTTKLKKYEDVYYDINDDIVNMRIWKLDLLNLPITALNKLVTDGLIIKTTGYSGEFDVTWEVARDFFYDKKNDVFETMDLP